MSWWGAYFGFLGESCSSTLGEAYGGAKACGHPIDTREGLILATADGYRDKILAVAAAGSYNETRDAVTGWPSVVLDLTGVSAMSEAQQGRNVCGDLTGVKRIQTGATGIGTFTLTLADGIRLYKGVPEVARKVIWGGDRPVVAP